MTDKIYKSKVRCSLLDAGVEYYKAKGVEFYLTLEDDVLYHNTAEQEKTPVSESDLEAIKTKQQELIEQNNALEYARKREDAYPSIEEQLDDLYHNGIDGWKATIKAIKDANPKE